MADTYKVKVNFQKVFHDGTSMVVLKPKGANPEVPEQFIKMLVDEGAIEAPKGWEAPVVVDDGGEAAATADGGVPVVPADAAGEGAGEDAKEDKAP